ncbi:MAG: sporulation protein YunB [Eubacteriales bacterium]
MRKNRNGRLKLRFRLLIFLIIVIIIAASSITLFEIRLKPIVKQMALASAERIATRAISEAVYDEMNEDNVKYEDLIVLEKDAKGKISALKTNVIQINRLKSHLPVVILDKLGKIEQTEINIPIGTIINGELLSGRGMRVNVRLVPVGSVTTDISNVFTGAGINQTRHQVMLTIHATVSLVMPITAISADIHTSICIAETIIVGEVPNAYTLVIEPGLDTAGEINDYGAEEHLTD